MTNLLKLLGLWGLIGAFVTSRDQKITVVLSNLLRSLGLWGLIGAFCNEQGPEDFNSFDKSSEIAWLVNPYRGLCGEHGP